MSTLSCTACGLVLRKRACEVEFCPRCLARRRILVRLAANTDAQGRAVEPGAYASKASLMSEAERVAAELRYQNGDGH